MTGKELRGWRNAMGYKSQARAANDLGVPLRTYQRWEAAEKVDRLVELAAHALSMRDAWDKARKPLADFSAIVRGH